MADLNEPKKETVRITSPPQVPRPPSAPVGEEKPRINLPDRSSGPPAGKTPLGGSRPSPAAPVRPPPPSVAPKPLAPAGGSRPPAPPMSRPPTPAPPGSIRPPNGPLPSANKPPPPPGFKPPVPVAPRPTLAKAAPPAFENRNPTQQGPRKETARIADSPMKATVRLSNVQPTARPPAAGIHSAPSAVANQQPARLVDSVPTPLCWAILGIAALSLLIQLWTYFS